MDFSPNPLYQLKRYGRRFRNPVNALGLGRFESHSLNREDRSRRTEGLSPGICQFDICRPNQPFGLPAARSGTGLGAY